MCSGILTRIFRRLCPLLPLALLPALSGPPALAAPVEITDDTGHTLRLEQPARRIIPLYGAFGEMLVALGCGDRLVARTDADAALPELAHLPAVGTHMRPNAELVAAARPDLVLQMSGRGEALLQTEGLRKLGVPVLSFEVNSFAQLFRVMEELGRLCGREAEAAALVADWKARLDALKAQHAGQKPWRIFYEVRSPDLLAAGRGGIVSDIIEAAGGENVVAEKRKLARLNEEAVLLADPDVYLVQRGPMNPAPQPLSGRPHFRGLRAVREGRTLEVDEALFSRPGPRSVEAAEQLAQWLKGLQRPDAGTNGEGK
ncbi:ABC transporter substrate-binding protein [Desulfovibrio sp.]|uniref:ABC transporter substrate-binding protein n=1 Tax=Desulfovibrio sp. TaxID=885 RepID=UPI00344C25A9